MNVIDYVAHNKCVYRLEVHNVFMLVICLICAELFVFFTVNPSVKTVNSQLCLCLLAPVNVHRLAKDLRLSVTCLVSPWEPAVL